MTNPFASETSTSLGILIARLALGATLLAAGYAHVSGGVGVFALANDADLPRWIPGAVAVRYSQVLPYLELAAGGMLVLGLTTRFGALLAAVTYAVILSSHGLHLRPESAHRHLPVYLSLAILLLCLGGGQLTADSLFFKKKSLEAPSGGH